MFVKVVLIERKKKHRHIDDIKWDFAQALKKANAPVEKLLGKLHLI